MGQELDLGILGLHHAIELLLDLAWFFRAVLLIKYEPLLHWYFLLLEELAIVLAVLFVEHRDITVLRESLIHYCMPLPILHCPQEALSPYNSWEIHLG